MNAVILVVLLLFSSMLFAEETRDPLEGLNRKTQAFNDFADRVLLKPVARRYADLLPSPVRQAAGNVYGNLDDVGDAVNNLLQGKPGAAINDLVRILVNTTIGVGGLMDPATRLGLEDHNEDFAQTLATWRIPRGPYLVLPFLGPSNLRDAIARPGNSRLDPVRYLRPVNHRNVVLGMRLVHQRADLLAADRVVFGDRYLFFRDAYLQRRHYLGLDGK
ncbi:MAG: VacJ family lipoprotein, partial [Proteobacteria bacterium]|nr:VacJ family lipoprotein [Pseudomonadota bacterium]